jgi:maleylpyruvate isomerase
VTRAVAPLALDDVTAGTSLLLAAVEDLTDADLDASSALPGWTRRHLLAHVASNAAALGRLLTWARTGVEHRMYNSPGQRADDIGRGARRDAADLRRWVRVSAEQLADDLAALPVPAWSATVVTAQGRSVPATEVVWLRAREVCVHAVDLDTGIDFADLPDGFCRALVRDVVQWRSTRPGPALTLVIDGAVHVLGGGGPSRVELSLPAAAGWLIGRGQRSDLPELPPWI